MSFLYKVLESESSSHLFNTLSNSNRQHQTKNSGYIPYFFVKHDDFNNLFFSSAITEWKTLDCYISNADSCEFFKKRVLSFIRLITISIYNIHNPLGVKYLTRLGIRFIHLKEHKFTHNFQDSVDPTCSCSGGIETTIYFFVHCANFNTHRQTPFDEIATIDANILTKNENCIVNTILFGKPNSENYYNKAMLNAPNEFIKSSERFDFPLF